MFFPFACSISPLKSAVQLNEAASCCHVVTSPVRLNLNRRGRTSPLQELRRDAPSVWPREMQPESLKLAQDQPPRDPLSSPRRRVVLGRWPPQAEDDFRTRPRRDRTPRPQFKAVSCH
ncbi:uncharacterized protein LOC114679611 [Macaca mulatta]